MATFSEKIAERANARRKIVEEHIKVVAAHTPMTDSELISHLGSQGIDDEGKENISDDTRLRTLTKKRLRKLGGLYSGEEVSSPIHRTEDEFGVEEIEEVRPSARSSARAQRLARLANTINQWEDDLSHPVIKKIEPVQYNKFGNVLRTSPAKKKFGTPSSSTSEKNKREAESPMKKTTGNEIKSNANETKKESDTVKSKRVMWDSSVIVALENQGFERCESKEHLIYDYKEHQSPAKCLSPSPKKKLPSEQTPKSHVSGKKKQPALDGTASSNSSVKKKCLSKDDEIKSSKMMKMSSEGLDCLPRAKVVPEAPPLPTMSSLPPKAVKTVSQTLGVARKEEPESRAKKEARIASEIVKELTPVKIVTKAMVHSPSRSDLQRPDPQRSPSPRKATQVLEMAAQYEVSTSPTKKKETDPSELPLSQRKALFEKNKGSAILPKAPFSMAVPAKLLNPSKKSTSTGSIVSQPKQVTFSESSSEERLNRIREERQKEMELLKVRWDKNKQITETSDSTEDETHTTLHQLKQRTNNYNEEEEEDDEEDEEEDAEDAECSEVLGSDSDDMRCPSTGTTPVKRGDPEWSERSDPTASNYESSPDIRCPNTGDTPKSSKKNYPMLKDVKKIKLSPPKPGHIYPSISDIEMETETETEAEELPDNNNQQSGYENDSMEESSDTSITSLGQTIVERANRSSSKLKRRQDSTSEEEARVLGEMDDILNCALKEPSPKRNKDSSFEDFVNQQMMRCESGSVGTDSFEYSHADSDLNTDVDQPKPGTQLVHTISLYRKQKQMTITATTTIKRDQTVAYQRMEEGESAEEMEQKDVHVSEDQLLADRIKELLLEMTKQQTIIFQASQALNLCSSTIEFSGSAEQIEAERLLLIASQRRLALNHEVDRLKVEKKLVSSCSVSSGERGDLTIHSICIPLKMDVIRAAAREEKCYNMVVLVRSGPTVLASEMQAALPKNLKQSEPFLVQFKTPLTLKQLYSDFTVTLEVYSLEARSKELLPHDIKYHITPSAKKTFVMPISILVFREKLKMTPKKASKNDTRLIVGPIESPGGPQVVRSTSFKMNGFAVFSLREINKTNFSLSKVSYGSVVEGNIQVKMSCEMTLAGLEYRGFLTMFQDVAGFGAWHRRWCYLKENTISSWLYPEHETTKIPLDTIDLRECCTDGEVGLVPRDVCARPNTFLIEIVRPRQPSDQDSLVMKASKHSTLIRHLMSADTREDRLEWCSRINKCLALLKAWGKRPSVKHTDL